MGLFPAAIRLWPVHTGIQGLEVDGFDLLQGKSAMWDAAGPDPACGAKQQCPGVLAGAHQLQSTVWGCQSFPWSVGDMRTRHQLFTTVTVCVI